MNFNCSVCIFVTLLQSVRWNAVANELRMSGNAAGCIYDVISASFCLSGFANQLMMFLHFTGTHYSECIHSHTYACLKLKICIFETIIIIDYRYKCSEMGSFFGLPFDTFHNDIGSHAHIKSNLAIEINSLSYSFDIK